MRCPPVARLLYFLLSYHAGRPDSSEIPRAKRPIRSDPVQSGPIPSDPGKPLESPRKKCYDENEINAGKERMVQMAFFNDLGKKIGTAAQGAAEKAKELAEIAKLNSEISSLEKSITLSYTEIGKTYFESQKNDPQSPSPNTAPKSRAPWPPSTNSRTKSPPSKPATSRNRPADDRRGTLPPAENASGNGSAPFPVFSLYFKGAAPRRAAKSHRALRP